MEHTKWKELDISSLPYLTRCAWTQRDSDKDEVGAVVLRTIKGYPTFRYEGISNETYDRFVDVVGTPQERPMFETLIRDEPTSRSTDGSPAWLTPTTVECDTCDEERQHKFVTPSSTICSMCGTVHYHDTDACSVCGTHRIDGGPCYACEQA